MANAPIAKTDSYMTDRILKHIALFSLLVFAYPIAFMTFHVMYHHLPGDSCVHSCCSHTNHHIPVEDQEEANPTQISDNKHCLICEYEFAKTEVTRAETFLQVDTNTNNLCEGVCNQIYLTFSGTNRSLRAPPVFA
jgi:hypothetical protein